MYLSVLKLATLDSDVGWLRRTLAGVTAQKTCVRCGAAEATYWQFCEKVGGTENPLIVLWCRECAAQRGNDVSPVIFFPVGMP